MPVALPHCSFVFEATQTLLDAWSSIGGAGGVDKLAAMAEIVVPRPAATVLTLRDRDDGYEILMLRRNVRSEFMGGAYVFPGGAVDGDDGGDVGFGLSDEAASRRLGVAAGGLAYYVASLRELFEEAGLLIACTSDGEPVHFTEPSDLDRLAAKRRALNAGELSFATVLREEGLRVDLRGVAYLAHWITPVGMSRRYDTRFFVALAPSGQLATHDAGETVADRWVRPAEALAAHARGEFEMMFPTIRTLEGIAHFREAREVLEHARSVGSSETVEPRVVTRDGAVVILLPGDEGFDD
jgi:8-oxo-dGTP pyrophosphatase MutT (NUDIX family)